MRIDLNVSFPEKDKAKALGARWDSIKRVWYLLDPQDLAPFLLWIPNVHPGSIRQPLLDTNPNSSLSTVNSEKPKGNHTALNIKTAMKAERRAAFNNRARITGPKHVLHCGCNVLPWEDCAHTLALSPITGLSGMEA
jgi:hypothetical protein